MSTGALRDDRLGVLASGTNNEFQTEVPCEIFGKLLSYLKKLFRTVEEESKIRVGTRD